MSFLLETMVASQIRFMGLSKRLATVNGSSMVVKTLGCRVDLSIFDLGCKERKKNLSKHRANSILSKKTYTPRKLTWKLKKFKHLQTTNFWVPRLVFKGVNMCKPSWIKTPNMKCISQSEPSPQGQLSWGCHEAHRTCGLQACEGLWRFLATARNVVLMIMMMMMMMMMLLLLLLSSPFVVAVWPLAQPEYPPLQLLILTPKAESYLKGWKAPVSPTDLCAVSPLPLKVNRTTVMYIQWFSWLSSRPLTQHLLLLTEVLRPCLAAAPLPNKSHKSQRKLWTPADLGQDLCWIRMQYAFSHQVQ